MSNILARRVVLRSAVSILAAYAIALQMLLASLAAAQMAAADPPGMSALCEGGGSAGLDRAKMGWPVSHAACAVCTIGSFAPGASPPQLVVSRLVAAAPYAAPTDPRRAATRRHDACSARGPPGIA